MMKILNSPLAILAALWCVAVLLVPVALAAEQGTGSMQAPPGGSSQGHGGQGNSNQMSAPPSGGQGGSGQQGGTGGQNSGNGGQMQAPPSGGMGAGNMTPPEGIGDGNMTMGERPMNGFGNSTGFGGPGGMQENSTMTRPDFGNMTAPDFGTMPAGNMTAPGMHGNITHHAFENETRVNGTAPADRPADNGPGDKSTNSPTGSSSTTLANQQSKDDVIASLITQLQALLSGKK